MKSKLDITIKKYDNEEDINEIIDVITTSFLGVQEKYSIFEDLSDREIAKEVVSALKDQCFIALHDKKIVGANFYVKEGISPDYQSNGIGKLLMEAVIEVANKDKKDLVLTVNCHNSQAFSLYTKLGFQAKKSLALMTGKVKYENKFVCRKMEEKDVSLCKKLCFKKTNLEANLHFEHLNKAVVAFDGNTLVGYSTGFQVDSHAVSENEEVILSLLSFFCEENKEENPVFFVSFVDYPLFFTKCLSLGFKILKTMFWMLKGNLNLFHGSHIYLPSI